MEQTMGAKRAGSKNPATSAALRGHVPTPCIVAIGASAGGFDAIKELLRRMPARNGLAFIVLQHLSPSPKNLSAELYSRHTAMSVHAAEEGMIPQADCVYTTPGDKDIRVVDGRLRLSKPTEPPGRRRPVDHLLRSLGRDQRQRAIGIILSGTGSDGALGLKDVVENGGIVLAQAPETAQFDGMPRSAIATGLVGYVLPVAKMPRVLVAYARHRYVQAPSIAAPRQQRDDPVANVLAELGNRSRQSFAGYKRGMIVRRIERRMGLLDIDTMQEYARRVKRDPAEAAALRKDLLISVTEFFRDRPAWAALDKDVLRPLIAEKRHGESIRAWVAGAATGEEAYTLAMLILARLKRSRKRCTVQIFGTDANLDSLSYARAGRYPLGIRGQVGERLLKQFFERVKDDHHYQVKPEVRESIIFGEHNLLTDPPFSRLDLVTCRNVLIYIEPAVQARILMLCHFALRPGGFLFLGSAESVGIHDKLFKSLNRKWHIYQRTGDTPREQIEWPAGVPGAGARSALPEIASAAIQANSSGHTTRAELVERFAPAAQSRASRIVSAHGRLQSELRSTQEDLRSAVSQLKSSNEDLRASHEETTSVNEELQSMNEELESSKEELQSVNEELNTVNTQLQSKVTELEVSNSDLRNLLASNEVATLCIDRSYRIKWFTPAAHQLFNLLPTDLGRPLTDLSVITIDSTVIEDSAAVLQDQTARTREIRHKGVFLRRIVPYRTDNRQIGGVVISFADITEAKKTSEAQILDKSRVNEQLEARVRERTEELGRLARELALAEVRERQNIARDLHDGLGQELNAASIKVDALRNSSESAASRQALDEVAQLLEGVVREMRSLTAQLNPPVLEQLGFMPALEWLSEEMRKTYQLEVALEDDEIPKPLDSVTASILFRAVRELLINVVRHAGVGVAYVGTHRKGRKLTVTVEDRGVGFTAGSDASESAGLGLAALRERIVHIGGSFQIETRLARGTTATIQVPLASR
jgi:chemotaxis methyl-accepting protein methylase/signal transduction histidine kinase